MLITDPKVKLQVLLRDNWVAANTNSQTPVFHTGWYNASWKTKPQVTITHPTYTVMRGGETGVTAIDGLGGNVRLMQCDLEIDCWAHSEMTNTAGTKFEDGVLNVKDFTYNMGNEVKRLVSGNLLADSELEWMTWMGMVELVDTRIQPVVFRYNNSIRLVWKETL